MPAGARLTINVTGGVGAGRCRICCSTVPRTPFTALDQTSFQIERTLSRTVSGSGWRGAASRWRRGTFRSFPIMPPVAWWTEPPGPRSPAARVRLPWSATDDYGVTASAGRTAPDRAAGRAAAGDRDPAARRRAQIRPWHPSARSHRPSLGGAERDRSADRPGRRRDKRARARRRRSICRNGLSTTRSPKR